MNTDKKLVGNSQWWRRQWMQLYKKAFLFLPWRVIRIINTERDAYIDAKTGKPHERNWLWRDGDYKPTLIKSKGSRALMEPVASYLKFVYPHNET